MQAKRVADTAQEIESKGFKFFQIVICGAEAGKTEFDLVVSTL